MLALLIAACCAAPRQGPARIYAGVLVPQPAGPSRNFLLCPLPQVAVFNGSKSPNAVYDAANWSCRAGSRTAANAAGSSVRSGSISA